MTSRSTRDWLVDAALFVAAVLFGLVMAGERAGSAAPLPPPWFLLDQVVGLAGCLALWWRRRWPVPLAVTLVVVSTVSELIAGAMLVALFTVAVHRPPRIAAAVFGLSLVTALGYVALRPEPDAPALFVYLLGVALQGTATGWGMAVHQRREVVTSLRERAERAEERARRDAREEVARDIHDSLGHRLSLLSVHAGALSYRPDAPAQDVARAAEVIRDSAHRALQDLREVVGVLRAPVGELPQPTFEGVDELVAESVRAGTPVTVHRELDGRPPDTLGRVGFRVVQEGLTNARTHAPGAAVSVRLVGSPGGELAVEVTNGACPAVAGREPGRGLLGLAERVALVGGRLEHGPAGDGGWRVAAQLPWPP